MSKESSRLGGCRNQRLQLGVAPLFQERGVLRRANSFDLKTLKIQALNTLSVCCVHGCVRLRLRIRFYKRRSYGAFKRERRVRACYVDELEQQMAYQP